ncbi:RHS repeat protein, partial [Neobacillus sp. YIM B02564]
GGRVWRSNAGDGVVKVMLYDLQGNQTAVLASASQDLKTAGSAAAADALTGLRRNTSQYDALGRVVRQNLASGGVIHQIWDRWGNCLSRSDARDSGMTTSWTYNASNQVIQQWQPAKTMFVESGTPGYASVPAQTLYYYDALGNLVATRDARGNVNGKRYDADGNVVSEHHADGG